MEIRYVAELLRTLAEDHAVPGAQLAVDTGSQVLSVATGVLREGCPQPVETSSAFAFGSVTKAFTATLAVQLASDGDIELDAPVAELLPNWRVPQVSALARVTLRHLLSHTSGLVSDHQLGDPMERSLAHYAASVAGLPLLFEPGSRFSYANTGYNVVGRLVEEITGLPWDAALRDFLLVPLGITPHIPRTRADSARTSASGHVVQPGGRAATPVDLFLPATWAPAGGLAGSAEDLLALARLHTGAHPRAARLLDAEHRAAMHRPQLDADAFGLADGWALGLGRYGADDGWLGHDGTVDGSTCHLRFHPETGMAVALTTNSTTGTLLWPELVTRLRAQGLPVADYDSPLPSSRTAAPTVDACRVLGDYANGDTLFSVRPHGSGVRLSDRTGLVANLSLHDQMVFSARRVDSGHAPWFGRFLVDGDNGTALMQLTGRSATRVATAA
ncbi:serine hydrolase domain-containing protein [Streptomyces sp. 11x1]|uniref:serine hydrolase domain-containing protein n=1 Tax=Streptomyces sp. 11x1 TaxID=3038642 RepID=UPI00292CAE4C|nr:serine hydrolase domain-containing protein [Streptomyces sp. 11x1]WNZ08510.1 serine hydrolase [Streptomyces sp. 11x1]